MPRLINAENLWKAITTRIEEYCDIADLIEIIEAQPTVDAVPVVRCEDCKYHELYEEHHSCEWHGFADVKPDWYCADGERREDADAVAK